MKLISDITHVISLFQPVNCSLNIRVYLIASLNDFVVSVKILFYPSSLPLSLSLF